MAVYTLLGLVQDILSSLNSDEVNSIGDSTEAQQVAAIVRQTYFNIVARAGLPDQNTLFQLTPSLTPTIPVVMYMPSNISKMEWVKYFNSNILNQSTVSQYGSYSHDLNTDLVSPAWQAVSSSTVTIGTGNQTFIINSSTLSIFVGQNVSAVSGTNTMQGTVVSYIGTTLVINVTNIAGAGTWSAWVLMSTEGVGAVPGYQYVTILPVRQFLDMTCAFNPTDSDVNSFEFNEGGENFLFYYKTDHQPQYCCILANSYVIFDTYDDTQDATLQASKTMCYGQTLPTWIMSDTFIPELNDKQFQLLLNEAKSLSFFELKQMAHPKAEQEAKRQWIDVSKTKAVVNRPTYFNQLPNFGRRAGTGGYSGTRGYPGQGFAGGWLSS